MTFSIIVKEVAPKNEGLITCALPRIDYSDAYEVELPEGTVRNVEHVARLFANASPKWVRNLMAVRNKLVSYVGLKMLSRTIVSETSILPGQPLGIFHIIATSPHEVLLGEDDQHLNFRISLLTIDAKIRFTTLIQYKNWWGKVYLFLIIFFHRLVVKATLKEIVSAIISESVG